MSDLIGYGLFIVPALAKRPYLVFWLFPCSSLYSPLGYIHFPRYLNFFVFNVSISSISFPFSLMRTFYVIRLFIGHFRLLYCVESTNNLAYVSTKSFNSYDVFTFCLTFNIENSIISVFKGNR